MVLLGAQGSADFWSQAQSSVRCESLLLLSLSPRG